MACSKLNSPQKEIRSCTFTYLLTRLHSKVLTVMYPGYYQPEAVPMQIGGYAGPSRQPITVVQHTTVNVPAQPPRDHIVWSLFSLVYCNAFCFGLFALIFSIKARDKKNVGDMNGARHDSAMARCLNIWATVVTSISVVITIILLIVFY